MANSLWPLLVAVAFLVATWFSTRLWASYLSNFALWVLLLLAVAVGWPELARAIF